MAEKPNYAHLIPPPPDDLINWLESQEQLQKEYLVYKASQYTEPLTEMTVPALRCNCTACGDVFFADRVEHIVSIPKCHNSVYAPPHGQRMEGYFGATHIKHGDIVTCPSCGEDVLCQHVSAVRNCFEQYCHPFVMHKVEGNVIIAVYCVGRIIYKDGRHEDTIQPYDAFIFTPENKRHRCTGYRNNYGNLAFFGFWEQRVKFSDTTGYARLLYPPTPNLLKGTSYENSQLLEYAANEYDECLLVSYLDVYTKHPQIEHLIASGLRHLAHEYVVRHHDPHSKVPAIAWREKSPRKMLGVNKAELEIIKQKKLMFDAIERLKAVRTALPKLPLEKAAEVADDFNYCLPQLLQEPRPQRLTTYLYKQAHNKRNEVSRFYHTWRDYMDAAESLGYNLNDPAVAYPPKLKSAHDRAISARKYAENEALKERFVELYEMYQPLIWEHNGLIIRPVRDESELIAEGKLLHHCVGGYGKTHCSGKSIFLIRKAEEPEKPFYTLQLDIHTPHIIQNHTTRNKEPTPEVRAFAQQWLDNIVKPSNLQIPKLTYKPKAARVA